MLQQLKAFYVWVWTCFVGFLKNRGTRKQKTKELLCSCVVLGERYRTSG